MAAHWLALTITTVRRNAASAISARTPPSATASESGAATRLRSGAA